jgi:hypothetical protein
MMLWTEPAGDVNPDHSVIQSGFTKVTYDEHAYSDIRRFIVVHTGSKNRHSLCV